MTTLEAMRVVGTHFNELRLPYAFLGASILPLLVEDPSILDIRPTVDIDLTVQIATLSEHYRLEETLRQRGFRNDDRQELRFVAGSSRASPSTLCQPSPLYSA